MFVFVINKDGKPLMPCRPKKAKDLLGQGRAKVVNRTPFTIQLIYGSGGYKQLISLGVDPGVKKIGVSATNEEKSFFEAELELRRDIKKLIATKRENRRFRRYRKTRYRKPRFLNRKRKEKWLVPSIDHQVKSHEKIIEFIHSILPISKLTIEIAQFDIQKLKNPNIQKEEYQKGDQLGFLNTKEYVFFRDKHSCQLCKGKNQDPILEVHHIESRKTGSNAPSNLVTLCKSCHQLLHKEKLEKKFIKKEGFKDASQITTTRFFIYNALKKKYKNVHLTYGYITKNSRKIHKLEKSHMVDARCISGNPEIPSEYYYYLKNIRKNNRKLHKNTFLKGGIRKNNKTPRFVKGFQLFDKVRYEKTDCFIYGRRSSGYFRISKIDGTDIHKSVNYKKLSIIRRAKTFLIIGSGVSSPCLKAGVSTPSV